MKTIVRVAAAVLLFGSVTSVLIRAEVPPPAGEPGSMSETHAPQGQAKSMPSPPANAEANLNGTAITIHYNTPFIRGRKIMGELVPYGKVWRTGANPATSFVTTGDLMVGNLRVPAGKYTLYTLPAAEGTPWQLIINKQTGQWGTEYNQAEDLGRTPMHFARLSSPQEQMSISFEKTSAASTQLHVRWETTDVWVELKPVH